MKKKAKKVGKLEKLPKRPTLEEILWALNGMKKDKVFLKNVKLDADGCVHKCFTKKGAELYGRLMDILRGVFVLSDRIDSEMIFEDLQETLDDIVKYG